MAKSRLAKWLKIIIPLSLGVFFVWYSIADTTPLERKLIWQNIKNANLFWVLMSILLGLISHIVRANRWKLLLKPLRDTPKLSVCFYTVMFGYLANLGIPRSGEVLRGASYASLSPLSFEQSFGTIITERLIDFIVLLIIIGIALIFQTDQLLNYLNISEVNPLNTLIYLSILIATIVVFYRLIKTTKNRIILKLKDFIYGFLQGIKTVFKLKQKWSFIAQTLIIWLLYIAMFWVIKYAIVGSENISIGLLWLAL
ncbi:lysylphosphatidylglycerol synthase transmembrane domain-containing protein [Flavobacterium sp. CS20]|uniref:lysylphosphatidylglycerol synthase transmembrane domain-containing protein n=1 Tax=Flavobacterium sp. CS20 TaxID=2775246 RepID=UPI001B39D16F|nr:lysylphosphatidylglycerol synthase transmembrane domain-containing protein [Flavobacterium sp. CS20]QTY26044.1 flippase-like domain-containing protein [Flavobacterium sp. CS20]